MLETPEILDAMALQVNATRSSQANTDVWGYR